MSFITCPSCNLPYFKSKSIQRTCLYCWRESQGHKLGAVDEAFRLLQQEAKKLKDKAGVQPVNLDPNDPNMDLRFRLQAAQVHIRMLEAEVEALKKRGVPPAPPPAVGSLTQESIRELITLCHPDKHSNSPLATKITQWLVSLRRR